MNRSSGVLRMTDCLFLIPFVWKLCGVIRRVKFLMSPTLRAGLPATIQPEGTLLVTTAPAPMITLSPTVTPGRISALLPTYTLFPIFMRPNVSKSGIVERITHPPPMCEKLYTRAIEIANLNKDDVVLDAYSGIGTIGLSVANKVKHVYGVEIVEDAIEDAKMNMKINNIGNASYVCGDAGEYMLHHQDIKFNVVFVDPPRKGLSSSFIDSLFKIEPKKIIYISCNPSTLARDLSILKDKYNIEAIEPFDMFPRTYHVETICALSFKGQK